MSIPSGGPRGYGNTGFFGKFWETPRGEPKISSTRICESNPATYSPDSRDSRPDSSPSLHGERYRAWSAQVFWTRIARMGANRIQLGTVCVRSLTGSSKRWNFGCAYFGFAPFA